MPLIRLSKNGSISIVCNCKSKEKKRKKPVNLKETNTTSLKKK